MASNLPIQPLQGQFKITDPETGLPTQEFLLYMKAIYDLLPSQEDAIAAIEGAGLTPLSARILLGANTRFGDEIEIDADTQAILNAISNVQGSILYRGATEWASLAPGPAGQFLRTGGAGADPTWAAGGGGGGGIGCYGTIRGTGGNSSSSFATKGRFFTPLYSGSVEGVVFNFSAVSGAEYIATVCEMSGANIVSALAQSSPWVAGASGQVYQPFTLSAAFSAGGRYAVMLTRTDSTSTYALPIAQAASGSFSWSGCPFTDHASLAFASTNPVSGSVNAGTAAFSGDVLMSLTP